MKMSKQAGVIAVAALGVTLLAGSSQADDSKKGGASSSKEPPRAADDKGGGGKSGGGAPGSGHEGQISVPPAFARGTAFLLAGENDCRLQAPWKWMSMAADTRDRSESNGLETPGFPIACARNGASATCKMFKDGLTFAFDLGVKTDTPAQLVLATQGGFLEIAVDLQKKTGVMKQTSPTGTSTSCGDLKYKSREDAAADVEKLDPPPSAALPTKDRPNGMSSGGDRHVCKSNHETPSAKDPLTGRRATLCTACSDKCGFVGEECKSGVCIYTGKGDDRGTYGDSSSRGSSAKPDAKKAKKGLGETCKFNDDCTSKKCGTISSGSLHKCVSR
jgi:hypothetical protein